VGGAEQKKEDLTTNADDNRRTKAEEGNERRKWKRVGVRTFEPGGNVYPGRRAFRDFNV
jgi:hypothetical protein